MDKRFAVLIDADNVSEKYIKPILDELSNDGVITYKCTVCDRVLRTEPIADEEPEEKTEEVIETKTNDSMRSFGAIETKKVVDEAIDNGVDDAWTKRYGG